MVTHTAGGLVLVFPQKLRWGRRDEVLERPQLACADHVCW